MSGVQRFLTSRLVSNPSDNIQKSYGYGGITTESGGYRTHIFSAMGSSSMYFATPGYVECIVVGGGGGGGMYTTTNANGGGGAGGLIYTASSAVVAGGSYTVVVGEGTERAGGLFQTQGGLSNAVGYNGSESSFNGITAPGGGGGATTGLATKAGDGGSGGGAAQGGGTFGISTYIGIGTPYGYRGGNGTNSWTGAGGGGATSVGVSGAGGVAPAGDGGQGYITSISGTTLYLAGGGGGGGNSSERAGDGWHGGGRGFGTTSRYNYNVYTIETNSVTKGSGTLDALPRTGGGGGGGSYWQSNGGWYVGAGKGASGIVIIRYLI